MVKCKSTHTATSYLPEEMLPRKKNKTTTKTNQPKIPPQKPNQTKNISVTVYSISDAESVALAPECWLSPKLYLFIYFRLTESQFSS